MASERAKYFASVAEREIMVWSFDFHITRYLVYMKVKPLRDSDALGSFDVNRAYAPVKSASTYSSTPLSKFGFVMVPLSLSAHRYFAILRIAFPCALPGLLEYFVH